MKYGIFRELVAFHKTQCIIKKSDCILPHNSLRLEQKHSQIF
ncbi:hypothetical protein M2138_001594 [Dysgonomonadaceae bacterium PH5-43]|nr:hypothetical protein [Dysgonomonadaceae bacterium PH5-43]